MALCVLPMAKPYLSEASMGSVINCTDLLGNPVEIRVETVIPCESALLSISCAPWGKPHKETSAAVAISTPRIRQLRDALNEILKEAGLAEA